MPSFVYKAKKESAETVMGQISAQNQDEAVELINRLGLLPVEVEEATDEGVLVSELKVRSVKPKLVYAFSRQLASLLNSGTPLLHALEVLARQSSNPYFGKVITEVVNNIRNGHTFSECLLEYPHIFSRLYVAMIAAGEESGRLKEMLMNMSVYQKKQQEIAKKVRTSLAYPILMGVVGIGTVIFILTFVMPRITVLFESSRVALPWPTQMLLNVSHFLQNGWIWAVAGALIVAIGARSWFVSGKNSRSFSYRLLTNLPLVGRFMLKVELERFCRTFALLLNSGLPILRSIIVATPTISHEGLRRDITRCREELAEGGSFGESLKSSRVVPSMIGQLIAVGEESGAIEDALNDISETYESEINETIKSVTTLIEPVMILSVGVVVGFIVFAMLLPIFQMDIMSQ